MRAGGGEFAGLGWVAAGNSVAAALAAAPPTTPAPAPANLLALSSPASFLSSAGRMRPGEQCLGRLLHVRTLASVWFSSREIGRAHV